MDPTGSFDVSPEGTHLAFSADCSEPPHFRIRSAIFEVGLADGVTTLLTADHPGPDVRPRYSPCGRYLLYGTRKQWDFYADRVRLVRRDRKTGKERVLNPDWILSPSEWVWSADSRVYCAVEDDGRTSILRISDGGTERLTHGGVLSGLALAGERIYFQHSTLSAPPEIASCPRDGGEVERMTNHTDGDMQQLDLGPVVDERFPGADGKDVQTFIVYPPDFDPRQKYPLVHLIHGGPHGIFGDAFNFRWNPHPIAAAGYVVAMVNFHGSTSFGQDFAECICGEWGNRPTEDILRVTDALIRTGSIDESRMAIAGGSYGGYLVAWLATQTDRYRCAICHAGVFDLAGMYAGDITQGRARAFGGSPWEDREAMRRWDPSSFAERISTPMLVIHGEKDFRVPATQGLELYGILKARGIDARLVYYPDENHWILKRENSIHWYGEFLSWLHRYLG